MINGPAINGPAPIFAKTDAGGTVTALEAPNPPLLPSPSPPPGGPSPPGGGAGSSGGRGGVAQLTVPFRDVHAADLVWTIGGPDETALHTDVHVIGGHLAEVRILGASHQIIMRPAKGAAGGRGGRTGRPTRDAEILRETVACREGADGSLPNVEELDLTDGYRYEFRCEVHRYRADDFPAWVKALTAHTANQATGTVGLFPDVPGAVTAVLVEPLPTALNGLLWRTWHTYPGAAESEYGEVVTTRTVVHRATPL